MATSPKDAPHIRIADLITLQERVVRTIVAQSQVAQAVRAEAQATLRRAADKLVRLEADNAVFDGIEAAAWEAVGKGELSDRVQDAAARAALAEIEGRHGTFESVRDSGAKDFDKGLALRVELDKVVALRDALEARMVDVKAHNADHSTVSIDEHIEKKFRESGMFSRMDFGPREKEAYAVYAAYNRKWTTVEKAADYFDDLRRLRALEAQVSSQQAEIDRQHQRYQSRAAALYEMARLRKEIAGDNKGSTPDWAGLVNALCKTMEDGNFLTSLSRHVPLAKAGPLLMAAVKAEALADIERSLTELGAEAIDTLKVLEGEVMPLAQDNKRINAVEMAEEDARVLAGMAGYMCISAAASVSALVTFQPENAEGIQALRRELRMHMAVAGKVDPAYINETMGMDQTIAGYFNIDRLTAKPDIKRVLGDTAAVARSDRRFAAFLTEIVAGDEMDGASFGNVRLDSDAFNAIMNQTKPNIPAAQQFAEIARLSKSMIGQAQDAYVKGLEPAPEQGNEADKPRGGKRKNDGPQP